MAHFSYNQYRAWDADSYDAAGEAHDVIGSVYHFLHWFSSLCLWGGIGVGLLLAGGRLGQVVSVLLLAWLGTGMAAVAIQLVCRPAALLRTGLYLVLSVAILYFGLTLGLRVPPSAINETVRAVLAGIAALW